MQYFLEGESKYNLKKVLNNKNKTWYLVMLSLPLLGEHVPSLLLRCTSLPVLAATSSKCEWRVCWRRAA